MFGYIVKGGILMIPIILCGLAAVFIIVERLFYFYVTKKRDAKLMFDLKTSLFKNDFEEAVAATKEADTPCAKVIQKAIECRKWNEKDLKDMIETEMDKAVPEYEHFLTPLGTISNISTLLGLLGTVTGNIKAFNVLGSAGSMGDPQALAGAIGEALITTVAGLIVSIPAVIFYNYFNSRVTRRLSQMEKNVTSVLIKLSGRESKYEI